eukprot:640451_1
MDHLWNAMVSFVIHSLPSKEMIHIESFEPAFPRLCTITSEIKEKSKRISLASLRNGMVSSCSEFNNKYFFLALQCALLVYCPTIALSIMYQSCDIEMQSDEQEIVKQTQDIQSFIKQQCADDSQQQSFTQFVQLMQRFISQMMRSQSSLDDSQQIQMYQPQQQQRAKQNNEHGAVGVKMAAKPSEKGQGRHDTHPVVWRTLIIIF